MNFFSWAQAVDKLGLHGCSAGFGFCPLTSLMDRMVSDGVRIYSNLTTSRVPGLCGTGVDMETRVANFYRSGNPSLQDVLEFARDQKGLEVAFGLKLNPLDTNQIGDDGIFSSCTSTGPAPVPIVIAREDRKLGTSTVNRVLIKDALKAEAGYIARVFRPKYFGFGVEIQGYFSAAAASNPSEITEFWEAFDEIKAHAKAEAAAVGNPDMKFFVYYQFEALERENLWPLLIPNKDKSDMYVFSSYPTGRIPLDQAFPGERKAENFPVSYYDAIPSQFGRGKPIGFFELGQPRAFTTGNSYSAPFQADPQRGIADQAEWIRGFFTAIENKNVEFAIYQTPYDTRFSDLPQFNDFFDKMGLREDNTDHAYPAWDAYVAQEVRIPKPPSPSLVSPLSDTLDNGNVSPNPLRPSQGVSSITFFDLPAGVEIKIFTISGRLVRSFFTDSNGSAVWNAKNSGGEDVSSGVYLALAKWRGQSRTFKIVIQR